MIHFCAAGEFLKMFNFLKSSIVLIYNSIKSFAFAVQSRLRRFCQLFREAKFGQGTDKIVTVLLFT